MYLNGQEHMGFKRKNEGKHKKEYLQQIAPAVKGCHLKECEQRRVEVAEVHRIVGTK